MKFGKQLVLQMVPEWQEAYMDYNYMKTLVKDIQDFNLTKKSPRGLTQMISSSYVAFSGLLQRNNTTRNTHGTGGDIENQVILVKPKRTESGGGYQTEFLMSSDEGGEYELVFFRRLDDEFNKVEQFYRSKVGEVLKEAAVLSRQMEALIAFRIKVKNPEGSIDWSVEMRKLRCVDTTPDGSVSYPALHGASTCASIPTNEVEEIKPNNNKERSDETSKEGDIKSMNHSTSVNEERLGSTNPTRPPPLEILDNVKINHTIETPCSTIKSILKVNKNKQNFGKENLRKVEEKLKHAFIEFYQKLILLKNYSFLNVLSFSKIMKKYDKATSRRASGSYLNMVDGSYLGSSDDVTKLIVRVEDTFVKHFSNANRSKGMSILRPKAKKERHRTTFFLGIFTGCTLALLVSLILIIQFDKILRKRGFDQYMQNMFPLYSLFGFVILHMFMYGFNIYFWRRYRVNYTFIFGFKQGTELRYREVFLLSTGLATLALASVLSNLDMEMNERTKDYKAFTELVPLGLVTLVFFITICPFNIIFRSSRFFLLRCAFHCICAPLYKVSLPDFFLADQLTSQIQALRSLEFYICYYGWGDYKVRQNTCKSNDVYNTFYFILTTIPYWTRLLQCLRRLVEEKDRMHGYNGLKYFSTIVAVLVRTAYTKRTGHGWRVAAWITSAVATIGSMYFDIIIDWGLLQRRSKNRWLRDKLILPHKSVYFIVMVWNVLLRLAWLQTLLNIQVSSLHRETVTAIVASLEIIRRGIWNFFRLENEHLNNVGKYRAFKSVPLPFNYDEDDDDKDS